MKTCGKNCVIKCGKCIYFNEDNNVDIEAFTDTDRPYVLFIDLESIKGICTHPAKRMATSRINALYNCEEFYCIGRNIHLLTKLFKITCILGIIMYILYKLI